MAEITASFQSKNITISYPDSLIGKAEESFVAMKNAQWTTVLADKKDELGVDNLTDAQLSDLKYQFTIECIVEHVAEVIKAYEIKKAVEGVESSTSSTMDSTLSSITTNITE